MRSILIIEDNPSWASNLRKSTDAKDTSIELVDNIHLAKEKLRSNKFDLIISDLWLSKGQRNIFETLSGIEYSLANQRLSKLPPLIIVTGASLQCTDIIETINKYPGWVGGWHEKDTFDAGNFQKNVLANLKADFSQSSFSAPNWWRIVLTVVGLFIVVSGTGWYFQADVNPQLESLLLTFTKATAVLGLAIVLLAYPDKIAEILPFLSKKDS